MKSEFYCHSIPRTSVTGSGSATLSVRFGAVATDIFYLSGHATAETELTVLFRITNRAVTLMDRAVLFSAIVGNAQRPFILPRPLRIEANSDLEIVLTDLSTSTNVVDLTLVGVKLYGG